MTGNALAPTVVHYPTHYLSPRYSCSLTRKFLKLAVRLPRAIPRNISIRVLGPDLIITAETSAQEAASGEGQGTKTSSSKGYFLRLRLGSGFDYNSIEADFKDSLLALTLPQTKPADDRRSQKVVQVS
ncbi:MAG TPA: Hsp20/alpha crystallin family protein [Opitutaceae bacterium]|nr:Hsp20/alpha crystallin family protein [Opitutaceae bacterium]